MQLRLRPALRRCLLLVVLLAMSGCTVYTKLPDPPAVKAEDTRMPLLYAALNTANGKRTKFESKRDFLARTHDGFNKAVFLLAGGAAGALIFDAPRLVALGLGAGAGAVYSYGALFHPSSGAILYNAGAQALACVYDKGAPALTVARTLQAQRALADPAADLCRNTFEGCMAAKSAYSSARGEAEAFLADDPAAAEAVREATTKVVIEVNRQAEAAVPDIGQVFAAASGIANIAKGFLPAPPAEPRVAFQAAEERMEAEALATLQTSTAAITRSVSLARDRLNSLATPCAVSTSAEAPLTIDAANSKITLKSNETREFSVSGGTQPLTVRWNGAVPPANVLDFVYLPPRTIRLMAKQVTEGSYNLLISDRSSAVNVEVTLSPQS